jgi:hypothetical protein
MNALPRETTFLSHVILYDGSDKRRKQEQSIAQVQQDVHRAKRAAALTFLLGLLAIAGVVYGAILHANFPFNGAERVCMFLCELALASLICAVGFTVSLKVYREKLNRLRTECHQLVTRPQVLHLDKPGIATSPGSYRGSDDGGSFQGAAESSGHQGSLDSPSWRSNRLCG